MSALTFKQMQNDVLDFTQDIQGQADFTLTRVKHLLNRGYFDFVRRTKCLEKTVDITTVADQETYSKTDAANLEFLYHIHTVKYLYSSTHIERLKPYPGGYANLPDNVQTGQPENYYLINPNDYQGITIGTWPICSTSSKTIRVVGYSFPQTELSADNDVPQIKPAWRDAPVYYTVSRLFRIYEHLNDRWRIKGQNSWMNYVDLVQDALLNLSIENEDEFPDTIDAYV